MMTELQAFERWPVVQRTAAHQAGQKFYFTGKQCKHGHWSQRTVATGVCTECNRINAQRFRQGRTDGGLTRLVVECYPADVDEVRRHVAALNVARQLEQQSKDMTAARLAVFPELANPPPGYTPPRAVPR